MREDGAFARADPVLDFPWSELAEAPVVLSKNRSVSFVPPGDRVLETVLQPGEGRPPTLPLTNARPISPSVAFAATALVLAELVVVTTRFDSEIFAQQGGWWATLLVQARYLPQALVAIATAAVVFAGPKFFQASLLRKAESAETTMSASFSRLLYLAAHFLAFFLFLWLTRAIWEGSSRQSPYAPIWAVGWFCSGLLAMACLVAVVLPPENWLALARRFSHRLPWIIGFGAAVCVAGRLTGTLLVPLHAATFRAAEFLLRRIFEDLEVDQSTGLIGTSEFQVLIAPECSGYEGIGLIWVFLTVYLWVFRRDLRFPAALWLIPLGTVVIWLANVGRIAALVVIGSKLSATVALGGFHSQAGWLAFNTVALGLVVLSRWTRLFRRDQPAENVETQPIVSLTAAYLLPLLALVASMMLATSLSSGKGFDVSYPLRVLAVGLALWFCRKRYGELTFTVSWQAVAVGVLVFVVWVGLEYHQNLGGVTHNESTREFLSGMTSLPWPIPLLWLIARVVGSVVTVPIAEELAFRGYLPRRFLSGDFSSVPPGRFTFASFLLSSLLFGLFHGRWLAGTLAGMAYALVYRRKGNLSEAIIAHATTNALIALQVLTTGAWSLWL